jgi:hypothetical protein
VAPGNASDSFGTRDRLTSMTRVPDLPVGSSRWLGAAAGITFRRTASPPTALRSSNDFRPEVPAGSSISRGVAPVVTATVSHSPRAAGEVRRIVSTVTTRRCQDCAPRQRPSKARHLTRVLRNYRCPNWWCVVSLIS